MASKIVTLDEALIDLGDLGKYQMMVLGLIGVVVFMDSAITMSFVFTTMDLEYRCYIPGCDVGHEHDFNPPWLKNAIPFSGEGTPSKCERYELYSNNSEINCSLESEFNQKETKKCSSYKYRTNQISILRQFDLQCESNLWKLTLVGTMGSVGQFFGMFSFGVVSDRFGRKFVLILGMVLCGITGVVQTFSPTYVWFVVFEFLKTFFISGVYACAFIMALELVTPKKRPLVGIIINLVYASGEMYAAGVSWLVLSWKPILYILYGPLMLLVFYFWLIPESIRWHLGKGETDKAKEILRRVAKVNKRELSESKLERLGAEDISGNQQSLPEVFKSLPLTLRFFRCVFCWITSAFLFYGIAVNAVSLVGNRYLNSILTSSMEIPSSFACAYVMSRFGRKHALTGSYAISGISFLIFIFISEDAWAIAIYLLGKFGLSSAFTTLYIVTTEIFPTPLRNSLMGACSTLGRVGSIVAPQTPLLATVWKPLPLVLFSGMSLISALLSWFFPETLNIKLPDTIDEALNIGKEKIKTSRNNN